MTAGDVSTQAELAGRKAENSKLLDRSVRVGLVAYGVMHLLIGWIAIQLAFGNNEGSASSKGAMSQLAKTPVGGVLLYVVAGGFAALFVWKMIDAMVGYRERQGRKRTSKRVAAALRAIVYATLGWSALKSALGGGSGGSGGGNAHSTTARLMSLPAGQLLVALVGLVVLAIGCRLIYKGLSEGFKKDLEIRGQTGNAGKAIVTFGKIGHVSKGLSFFIVAGLFLWAAWTHDPKKSGGLDQALHQLLQQPFGAVMLVALAAGIGCYGLYALAWARHLES